MPLLNEHFFYNNMSAPCFEEISLRRIYFEPRIIDIFIFDWCDKFKTCSEIPDAIYWISGTTAYQFLLSSSRCISYEQNNELNICTLEVLCNLHINSEHQHVKMGLYSLLMLVSCALRLSNYTTRIKNKTFLCWFAYTVPPYRCSWLSCGCQ